ncbi:MAG: hypothetical protein V6D39_09190 [Dolichospermum lemmermannii FEM_B0920]
MVEYACKLTLLYSLMYSPTAVLGPEKSNTWGYVLESRTSSGVIRLSVELNCPTLKSRSYVARVYNEDSANFAKQIEQELTASLGDITTHIPPQEFVELMSQEWAKAYSPQAYYKPSLAIQLIVRPYAAQDSLPSEVVKAIADELEATEEIALDYGIKAKAAINQGLV